MHRFLLTVIGALTLVACGAQSRAIPDYTDKQALKDVLLTLSPWQDGSADRSRDGNTPGEQNSDRRVFGRWFDRYRNHELTHQHDRDYKPFDVPGSVGAAINQQRQFELNEKAAYDAAQPERDELIERDERRNIAIMRGIVPCGGHCEWEEVDEYIYSPEVNQLYEEQSQQRD